MIGWAMVGREARPCSGLLALFFVAGVGHEVVYDFKTVLKL